MNGMLSELARKRFAAFRSHIGSTDPRGRWLILTHDNPDPDALTAATILAKVLRSGFQRRVTAAYRGIIGRAENQEMVRSLGMQFSQARRIKLESYRFVALVDCQPATGNSPCRTISLPRSSSTTIRAAREHPRQPSTTCETTTRPPPRSSPSTCSLPGFQPPAAKRPPSSTRYAARPLISPAVQTKRTG